MPSIVSTMSLCQISTIHQNKLHKSRLSVSPHLMSLSTKSLAAAFAEKNLEETRCFSKQNIVCGQSLFGRMFF